MKIDNYGHGECHFNIIVGVHGDERAPIEAYVLLKEYLAGREIKKAFNIITANETALAKGQRYIESDLNRCFPGKSDGDLEERLANEMGPILRKARYNFDLHSTTVPIKKPYGIISVYSQALHRSMSHTGVENYIFDNSESLIKFAPKALAIEVGCENDPLSIENAFEIMKNILIYFGVIDKETTLMPCVPSIFLIYHFVLKERFTSLSSELKDFTRVNKGDILGIGKNNEQIRAEEAFYIILVNDKEAFKKAKKISIEE